MRGDSEDNVLLGKSRIFSFSFSFPPSAQQKYYKIACDKIEIYLNNH